MSSTLQFKYDDKITPEIRAWLASLTDRTSLMKAIGKSAEVALREHFRKRNLASNSTSKRAARGFPQYGIWNHIRQSTSFSGATNDAAQVTISEPAFRGKYYGLKNLRAQRSTYLAIPLDARVYGKRARGKPVAGMFPVTIKRTGKKYLAVKDGDGIKVLYRLMLSVTVAPDKTALPSNDTLSAELSKVVVSKFKMSKA